MLLGFVVTFAISFIIMLLIAFIVNNLSGKNKMRYGILFIESLFIAAILTWIF